MTTVLKPGVYKILKEFYVGKNNKIHLREMARKTGMHGQSIYRYLNELEKKKILKSEKDGNLKKYMLRHNQEVYALLALFDVEKVEKLPLMRKSAIMTYINSLPSPPVFAVVFGSTAKESYTENSDIDILLITYKKIDTKNAEKEADALNGIKISTFQITYEEFKKELKLKQDKVVQSALESGYPLLNHLYYYWVLKNERV